MARRNTAHAIFYMVICKVFLAVFCTGDSKFAYFKVHENTQKRGKPLYRVPTLTSSVSCGLVCLQNSECTSTNFYLSGDVVGDLGFCELFGEETDLMKGSVEYEHGVVHGEINMDCRVQPCSNDGMCVYNKSQGEYACDCHLRWKGKHCEIEKDLSFMFTPLGATGRNGPTNASGYRNTLLDTTVLIMNGTQIWTAPLTGQYHVTVCGAAGADGNGVRGGRGAKVNGTVFLERGEALRIVVGQKGATKSNASYGSGGGGSFAVFKDNGSILAIAGGGGGGGIVPGDDGQADTCGSINSQCKGNGGNVCASGVATYQGGGGGFYGNGLCKGAPHCVNKQCSSEHGGEAFVNGGRGGKSLSFEKCDGGYGGGGECSSSGGGGGGYSGGGVSVNMTVKRAGGGGSFRRSGWDWIGGFNTGDGRVIFKLLN